MVCRFAALHNEILDYVKLVEVGPSDEEHRSRIFRAVAAAVHRALQVGTEN